MVLIIKHLTSAYSALKILEEKTYRTARMQEDSCLNVFYEAPVQRYQGPLTDDDDLAIIKFEWEGPMEDRAEREWDNLVPNVLYRDTIPDDRLSYGGPEKEWRCFLKAGTNEKLRMTSVTFVNAKGKECTEQEKHVVFKKILELESRSFFSKIKIKFFGDAMARRRMREFESKLSQKPKIRVIKG